MHIKGKGRAVEFEKDIEHYLNVRVSDVHGLCLKLSGLKGIPDRLVVLPPDGRCVWVELKRKDGRLSELQKYQHARLRKIGADVAVVWNREDVDKLMDRMYNDTERS